MDQIWSWLSGTINPSDFSPSGQHVLQAIQNGWQEQYRECFPNWERSINSEDPRVNNCIQSRLVTSRGSDTDHIQFSHHESSLWEGACSSIPKDEMNVYTLSSTIKRSSSKNVENMKTFTLPSPTGEINTGSSLRPVIRPASCDIFSDRDINMTNLGLSTFDSQDSVEKFNIPKIFVTGTYEGHEHTLSTTENILIDPLGTNHKDNGNYSNSLRSINPGEENHEDLEANLTGIKEKTGTSAIQSKPNDTVMSGNVSLEEWEDLNRLLADCGEFFQDIPEFTTNEEKEGGIDSIINMDENDDMFTKNDSGEPQQWSGDQQLYEIMQCDDEEILYNVNQVSKEERSSETIETDKALQTKPDVSDRHQVKKASNAFNGMTNKLSQDNSASTTVKPLKSNRNSNKSAVQKKKSSDCIKISKRIGHQTKTFEPDNELCINRKYPKAIPNFKALTIPDMFLAKRKEKTKLKEPLLHNEEHNNAINDQPECITSVKKLHVENTHKKRKVFQVPFKKETIEFKEPKDLNIRGEVPSNVKYHITVLDCNTFATMENKVKCGKLLEVGFTIMYREGYCQLNQPMDRSRLLSCSPAGIMLSLSMDAKKPEYCYVSLDTKHWDYMQFPRNFISNILKSPCRKICFKAQEMLIMLIKILGFQYKEVCMNQALLDSMVGCWLLDPDNPAYDFSTVKTMLGFNKSKVLSREPHTKVCQLLEQLSQVMELLYQKLDKSGLWKLFLDMEMKIIPILAAMECCGIYVEKKKIEEMGIILEKCLKKLQDSAYKTVGKKFQLNSTLQLRKILYEELKLDKKNHIKVKETSAIGAKSTSEPMLRLLEPFHPLPGIVLEYRHLQKVKSTYIDAILQQINGEHIFSTWELTSAATGRITSSNPNLQALPKQPVLLKSLGSEDSNTSPLLLRSPYQPRPGFTFLAADFQHIELRIFAHLAQDSSLLSVFQQPGDIFLTLAQMWLGKTNHTIGMEDREKTKRIVYSVMYGAGTGKLAEFLRIEQSEASQIINSFVGHFPTLRTFPRHITDQCREKGCLRTIGGRRRLFPNICSSNPVVRAHTERQAINFVIQGSAADVCKAFMLHTEQLIDTHSKIEAHLVLQIHDELVWEVKDTQVDIFKDMIHNAMQDNSILCKHIGKFSIPLSVSITTGKNLADMKS